PLLLTPRDALAAALGVAAMTVQGKALVAAVVVACAVGVAVVARDDADPPRIAGVEAGAREAAPRPDDGTPAPARADAKIAAAPYVEESGEASEIPASAPVAPHDGCTLRGRVLDADGRPVAACDVVVSSKELCSVVFEERDLLDRLARGEPGYPPPLGAVGPPRVVRTDDEGRFAAEDLPASADAGVAAVSPRHGVATAVGVALKPGAAHDVALAFPPAVTVFGRVLDDEGRPIEGQSVFFMGGRGDGAMSSLIGARTDATGTYRTPPVARAELTAQVQRAGFKFAHRRIERIGPEERGRRVDFALERAPQLRGRLLAAGGGPARLKETLEARGLTERSFRPAVLGSWEDPATVANFLDIGRDRGAASLDDDSWTLSPNGDAPRFVSVWVGRALVASEESRGRLEFDLVVDATKLPAPPKRTPLHVRVVDAAGVPLPDSTVRLDRRFGAWIVELERVMPDPPAAPGLHVFPRLGPGAFTLEASAKGYASRLFDVVIGGGPAAAEATVVLARPAGAVDVLVRGPDGPLNRAAVALHDAEGRPLRSPTPANAEGRATFEGLAEGAYFVSATADGLAGAGRPVRVAAGRASVALQLSAGVAVSIDPEGSLGPFTFRYFDECGVPIHDGLAGGGRTYGDVETVRLPPGPVTVEVLCPDHEPARVAFDAKDGATVKVPLVRKGG
ncbi:MAG TPA: carboxypeptidase-like regulatory domain-containing protein, partial [Planctomycetota bacterium]|nr:carboxypeptidase-like regulatory domain-containing protein [Planctomycetota bacterium]